MSVLSLVYAPHSIFKQKAAPVEKVDEEVRRLVDNMFETLYFEKAVGLGANMVGVLKKIAVIDMMENGISKPYCFINPEITWYSEETQTFEEASLCFPGISANITRPRKITVNYLDRDGNAQELTTEDFFATVIQHEVDYLYGKVFLDYLPRLRRDMLLKKMQKFMKLHPPHIHGAGCKH